MSSCRWETTSVVPSQVLPPGKIKTTSFININAHSVDYVCDSDGIGVSERDKDANLGDNGPFA